MSTISNDISRLHQKLQLLLKQYQGLQKEQEKLQTKLKEVEDELGSAKEVNQQLQQQVWILKSAASQLTEEDKKSFEKQINGYIREIDKCLTLLSE